MKQDLRPKPTAPPPTRTTRGRLEAKYRRRRAGVLFAALCFLLLVAVVLRVTGVLGGASTRSADRPGSRPSAQGPGGSPAAAPPTHRLIVTSHPEGATLVIQAPNRVTQTVKTPFRARLLVTNVTLTLKLDGYNSVTRPVELTKNRKVNLWLDERGQLLHKLGEFKTGSAPKQVAFSPDGSQMWVTLLGGDGVQVFDSHTYRLIEDIKLGEHGGVEVIFNDTGTRAYVSQMETASVYEVDATNLRVIRQMSTDSAWSKFMVLSPDEKTLFVANWSGDNVTSLNLTTGEVAEQIPAVDTPRGLYVTPDGKRLFIAGFGHGELQRVNLVTGDSKILVSSGGAMRHLVGDPSGGMLYADDMANDQVFVVDLATEKVVRTFHTDHMPNTIDLSPDGKVLYVSNRGANNPVSYYVPGPEWGSVLALDTATGKPLDAIVGGNQTTGLDVSDDGTLLAFSDFLDNRLSVYEIPSYPVLAGGRGGRYQAHLAELAK
jgi:DNA-binding beta-propeller fold protein YncE